MAGSFREDAPWAWRVIQVPRQGGRRRRPQQREQHEQRQRWGGGQGGQPSSSPSSQILRSRLCPCPCPCHVPSLEQETSHRLRDTPSHPNALFPLSIQHVQPSSCRGGNRGPGWGTPAQPTWRAPRAGAPGLVLPWLLGHLLPSLLQAPDPPPSTPFPSPPPTCSSGAWFSPSHSVFLFGVRKVSPLCPSPSPQFQPCGLSVWGFASSHVPRSVCASHCLPVHFYFCVSPPLVPLRHLPLPPSPPHPHPIPAPPPLQPTRSLTHSHANLHAPQLPHPTPATHQPHHQPMKTLPPPSLPPRGVSTARLGWG